MEPRTQILSKDLEIGKIYFDTMGELGSRLKFVERQSNGNMFFKVIDNSTIFPYMIENGVVGFPADDECWYLPNEGEGNED